MAIFKWTSRAVKAAEAQPVAEVKQTPKPFELKHMSKLSDTSSPRQQRTGHSDLYLARSPMYGYHGGGTPAPNTPTGRGSNQVSRSSSGYFGPPSTPSFDSPILGNPKMAAAARDQGYVSPHVFADSDSGSVARSSGVRSYVSGEKSSDSSLSDERRGHVEVSSDDKLGHRVTDDYTIPTNESVGDSPAEPSQFKRRTSGVLKGSSSYVGRTEEMSNGPSEKPSRSGPKQARFQHLSEDETLSPYDVTPSTDESTQNPAQSRPPDLQYRDIVQRCPDEQLQLLHSDRAEGNDASPQVPPIGQAKCSVQQHDRLAAPRPNMQMNTGSAALPTSLMLHDNEQAPVWSPQASSIRRGSVPPLSILDGFKVNKKGKILDEEGEPIGELVDGDIMDCVRQKVNAMGEVLNEYGDVVGRVRTLERVSMIEEPLQATHVERQLLNHCSRQGSGAQDELAISMSSTLITTPTESLQHVYAAPPTQKNVHITSTAPSSPWYNVRGTEKNPQAAPQLTPPSIPPLESVNKYLTYDAADSDSSSSTVNQSDNFVPDDTLYAVNKPLQSPAQILGAFPIDSAQPSKDVTPIIQHMRMSSNPEVARLIDANTSYSSPAIAQTRRSNVPPLLRNLSDSSLSELSKTYARPTMTSVPENGDLPDEDRNPSRYSYKGEIPAADGPIPGTRLPFPSAVGARAVPSSLPKTNLDGPLPQTQHNGAKALNFAPFESCRNTPLGPIQGCRPALSARSSYSQPTVRSPLSSPVNSPPDSERSTSDDGKHVEHLTSMRSLVHRPMSTTSPVTSTNTGPTKTRTHFTHAGRFTVGPGEHNTPWLDAAPSASKSEVVVTEMTATKKKRFNLRRRRE